MKVLTTGQTAKALQISIDSVVRLIKSGELRAERLTKTSRHRIKEADLIAYAKARNVELIQLEH